MTAAERITGRPEGGWIVTGVCGRPHLVGRGWSWWRCPVDHRKASRDRITAAQKRLMAYYYPPGGQR